MTTEPTTSRRNSMKVIFNYQNVFFSFFYDDADACVHRSREYAMNYVLSGEMVLDDGYRQIHVGKGECVFIPRDHRVTMYKKASGGEQYCGIYMCFTRSFLREMYGKYARHTDAVEPVEKFVPGVMKLPPSAEIESLFASMTPYFNPEVKPQDDVIHLKLQEGLLALLHTDKRFMTVLFDFSTPWKMDILDFMNENYMYEFTLEELAHYTGRSLATFKRDFKKVSELTPEKWLIRKRLEVAYHLLKEERRKVVDVYAEVGFKNPSHFSTAFKKRYGISPTALGAPSCI